MISSEHLLVFSTTVPYVLSPFIPITHEQFTKMLDQSGGKEVKLVFWWALFRLIYHHAQGHAKLHVLNCKELQEKVEIDDGLFTQLCKPFGGG